MPWSGGIRIFFLVKLKAQGAITSKTTLQEEEPCLKHLEGNRNSSVLFFWLTFTALQFAQQYKMSVRLEGKQWPSPFI